METGNGDWDGDWRWRLGMKTGNGDWGYRLEMEIGDGDW